MPVLYPHLLMKSLQKKLSGFLHTMPGMVVIFVVLFYALTYSVYYFYSPGPEERRQAALEEQQRIRHSTQNSSITINVAPEMQPKNESTL